MRSYVLTAALAATLLSTSLSLGYAASPTKPATGINAEISPADQMPAHKIYPAKPVAYRIMHPGSRLSKIDSELGVANRRIEADRHHGYSDRDGNQEGPRRGAGYPHRRGRDCSPRWRAAARSEVRLAAGARHRPQPDDPSLREQFRTRLIRFTDACPKDRRSIAESGGPQLSARR